jgi:hypothetical protein
MECYHGQEEVQGADAGARWLAGRSRLVAHPRRSLAILLHEMDVGCCLRRHVSRALRWKRRSRFDPICRLIAMNSKSQLNCQALYTFNQFGGHSAIGGSTLLYVRFPIICLGPILLV